MTASRLRTDAAPQGVLRLLLGVLMALSLGLFVAQAAPEITPAGGMSRAWLTAAPGGAAGLHHRETARQPGLAPQPLAVLPPQGPTPRRPERWTWVQAKALTATPARQFPIRFRARAPPAPVL
ncbi:hypothetical protein GL279_00165 [Paracoccus limosus]|uniref:Uncharacterized protein n=1 Tax=Paracoccus limosus TaxID=913252 RepID=A0A844GX79_9RHOB|nr:hypothetical protein [Paracoccus limosus]MTH33012.1 hypothetical protein [Paracoccus limosus]